MKRKILSLVMGMLMIFSIIPTTNAVNDSQKNTTIIISSNFETLSDEESIFSQELNAKHIQQSEVSNTDLCSFEKIIVDTTSMDEIIQDSLQSAYNSSSKIFVLGDISENELRNYFGLKEKKDDKSGISTTSDESSAISEETLIEGGKVVDVSQFPEVGKLVYQDWRGSNITTVKSSNIGNTEEIEALIQHCFEYDYLGLATKMESELAPMVADSWTRMDVETDSFDCDDRCIVDTSIMLNEYDGNPDSRGNYYYYVPFTADITNKAVIRRADVTAKGSVTSTIDDYGPTPKSVSAGANVSFSLPFSISVSFAPGPRIQITKEDGGINNRSVTLRYQPKTPLGINGYIGDDLRCDVHIESYQEVGAMAGGFGTFSVLTYEYGTTPSGDYTDPITYENSHPCTVG